MQNDIIDALIQEEELTAWSDLLTERQFNVILYQSEDLTYGDIATIMGLTYRQVKRDIHQIRRMVKYWIAREERLLRQKGTNTCL